MLPRTKIAIYDDYGKIQLTPKQVKIIEKVLNNYLDMNFDSIKHTFCIHLEKLLENPIYQAQWKQDPKQLANQQLNQFLKPLIQSNPHSIKTKYYELFKETWFHHECNVNLISQIIKMRIFYDIQIHENRDN